MLSTTCSLIWSPPEKFYLLTTALRLNFCAELSYNNVKKKEFGLNTTDHIKLCHSSKTKFMTQLVFKCITFDQCQNRLLIYCSASYIIILEKKDVLSQNKYKLGDSIDHISEI